MFLYISTMDVSNADFQETFDDAVRDEINELHAKYKIGAHPSFPLQRIYTQPDTGFFYDLDHIKISSWANHIVRFNSFHLVQYSYNCFREKAPLLLIHHPLSHTSTLVTE